MVYAAKHRGVVMQSSHGDGASTCSRNFSCRRIERPRKSGTNTRWEKWKLETIRIFFRSIDDIRKWLVLYTDWSWYISFTGIIWTVLWRVQISMALHYWKISGNLTVLSFFFFFFRSNISKFPYRGNRVTFPQKRKHISKCSHEIPARSLHAILNFIACRVFNLNVVSVSCIGNAKLIKSE